MSIIHTNKRTNKHIYIWICCSRMSIILLFLFVCWCRRHCFLAQSHGSIVIVGFFARSIVFNSNCLSLSLVLLLLLLLLLLDLCLCTYFYLVCPSVSLCPLWSFAFALHQITFHSKISFRHWKISTHMTTMYACMYVQRIMFMRIKSKQV